MKKKAAILSMSLCLAGAAAIAGCGGGDSAKSTEEPSGVAGTEGGAAAIARTYDPADYVTLGDYKGLSVQSPIPEVSDEDVQYYIDDVITQYTEYNPVKGRPAANGDYVNIDFVGTKDGEEFDGGSATDYEFTLGNGEFLEDFESHIVGLSPGESTTFNLTFPDDYVEDLAGTEVEFTATLNSISEVVTPEYNDEFVAEISDYDNTEDYEKSVREELLSSEQADAASYAAEDALTLAIENATIDGYPQELYDEYYDETVQSYKDFADMMGMEYEDFLSENDMTEEDLKDDALSSVNDALVVAAIADAEGLNPSDAEYEEDAASLATEYGYDTVKEFAKDYGESYVRDQVLRERVLDFLASESDIEEVSETEYYGE